MRLLGPRLQASAFEDDGIAGEEAHGGRAVTCGKGPMKAVDHRGDSRGIKCCRALRAAGAYTNCALRFNRCHGEYQGERDGGRQRQRSGIQSHRSRWRGSHRGHKFEVPVTKLA